MALGVFVESEVASPRPLLALVCPRPRPEDLAIRNFFPSRVFNGCMKTPILCLLGLAILGCSTPAEAAGKRTADYLLTNPLSHEGKSVTVDAAFVKPIRWVSPFPEIVFFHVMTVDRGDHKPGGAILAAVEVDEAEAFAKKYGTDFGRRDADALRGVFLAAGGGGPDRRGRVWLIDTTDRLKTLMAERKLEFPGEILAEGFGPPPGGRRPGPR